jgi:hypothetical protein
MGSKSPKLRGKSGGTKSKDMPKGSPATTAKVMRVAQAVASGGKSEVTRAVKKRLGKAGGGMAKKRMAYNKGGYASVYDMESDCKGKAGYNTMKIKGEK